jgi:hypothetical protein
MIFDIFIFCSDLSLDFNTTGATRGTRTVNPSGAHEFIQVLGRLRVALAFFV